jgi:hypothetical protein
MKNTLRRSRYSGQARKLNRRLESLEKGFAHEVVTLTMPDGHIEVLRGPKGYVVDLFKRTFDGDPGKDTEMVARSISSTESTGGQMIDLARAIVNSPTE